MNYYKLRINVELVGKRDVLPVWEYDVDLPNAEGQLSDTALPEFEPVFSNLYITKVTDIIDDGYAIGGEGFIIGDRVKDLFSGYKLGTHKFYKLDAYSFDKKEKIEEEKYYWLQIISTNFEDHVNYKQSDFYLFDDFEEEKIKDLSIKNAHQLKKEIGLTTNTDNVVMFSKLTLKDSFENLDLFYMKDLHDNIFNYPIVSERLKNHIEERKIVAFEFKKVNINYEKK